MGWRIPSTNRWNRDCFSTIILARIARVLLRGNTRDGEHGPTPHSTLKPPTSRPAWITQPSSKPPSLAKPLPIKLLKAFVSLRKKMLIGNSPSPLAERTRSASNLRASWLITSAISPPSMCKSSSNSWISFSMASRSNLPLKNVSKKGLYPLGRLQAALAF